MPKIIIKVRAIVEYRKKVLIIKELFKRGYFWSVPGGHFEVDKDKNLASAMGRELFEEVGIRRIKKATLMNVREHNHKNKDFALELFYKIELYAPIRIKLGHVSGIQGEHIADYRWIDAKDLRSIKPSDFCFVNNYEMLKRFFRDKEK